MGRRVEKTRDNMRDHDRQLQVNGHCNERTIGHDDEANFEARLLQALQNEKHLMYEPSSALKEAAIYASKVFSDPIIEDFTELDALVTDKMTVKQVFEQIHLMTTAATDKLLEQIDSYKRKIDLQQTETQDEIRQELRGSDGQIELKGILKRERLPNSERRVSFRDHDLEMTREISDYDISESDDSNFTDDSDENSSDDLPDDDSNEELEEDNDDDLEYEESDEECDDVDDNQINHELDSTSVEAASTVDDKISTEAAEAVMKAVAGSDDSNEGSEEDLPELHTDSEDGEQSEHLDELDQGDDDRKTTGSTGKDVFGLNDGFFDIDEFNRQTMMLEEDELAGDSDDAQEGAFLDADGDDGDDDGDADDSVGDIYYGDFFDKPEKKTLTDNSSKKLQSKRLRKSQNNMAGDELRDIEDVDSELKMDLFAGDDGSDSDENDDLTSRKSSAEKRHEALRQQIEKYESENVARKDWMLMGEASVRNRPENSLLELDESDDNSSSRKRSRHDRDATAATGALLEFEQTLRPVPTATAESEESLEELIRQRIADSAFDDVPAKLLKARDALPAANQRQPQQQLDDRKSKHGLAQLYENEYLQRVDPEHHVSDQQRELTKAQREIESLWQDVQFKLDALASWSFKPKRAKELNVVVEDVPTLAIEEAQPIASVQQASRLAPQDIYKLGGQHSKRNSEADGEMNADERVGHGGMVIAKAEMTRDQKRAAHRRDKRRRKKRLQSRNSDIALKSSKNVQKNAEKRAIVADLARAGVQVIGKHGEKKRISKRGLEDSSVVQRAEKRGSAFFKL